MSGKLCVFPNDPLKAYLIKGEIKYGYFNPGNHFDEVHVISLFDDEVETHKVSKMGGTGKLFVHKMGKTNLKNYRSAEATVVTKLQEIKPDIIRAYNPLVQGWLATRTGKKLGLPVVLSLHTNYDQQLNQLKKERKYFQFLKSFYAQKRLAGYSIQNADAVICVYEFIVSYARRMGCRDIQVIYNGVNSRNFSPEITPVTKSNTPTIISVGNQINQRPHMYLLEAIKHMDVRLVLVGDGLNHSKLADFVRNEDMEQRVEMIRSIPNEKLGGYYTSADIYAYPLENLGGVSITILEAMSCGLPVVMSRREGEDSEITDEAIYFVDNNADSFRTAFERILSDYSLKESLRTKSLDIAGKIQEMADMELHLYKRLL